MSQIEECEIPADLAGQRLDQVLAGLFSDYSRSRIQGWIKAGRVQVDGVSRKAKYKVLGEEMVRLNVDLQPEVEWRPEPMSLDVVYEDDDVIVINKAAGLVVHPAVGNWSGTLVNGLLHYDPELNAIPRGGVVHRLDKGTTGLMVVARSLRAHAALIEQLADHSVQREYQAIVYGVMTAGGSIDKPIGRHPVDRKRMAVTAAGKRAVSHYRVIHRYRAHTHVRVMLETGRTHQIRVHMAHQRFPLIGDAVYSGRARVPGGCTDEFRQAILGFPRQALHAAKLSFSHPADGREVSWEVPLPDDMLALLDVLAADQAADET